MSSDTRGITPGTVCAGCLTEGSSADGAEAAPPALFHKATSAKIKGAIHRSES
jgi:hypothetical protein